MYPKPYSNNQVKTLAAVCVALAVATSLAAAMLVPGNAYAAGKAYFAVTKATTTYAYDNSKETTSFRYNSDGLVQRETKSVTDDDPCSWIYAYTRNAYVKSAVMKINGKTTSKYTYKADRQGRVIKEVEKNATFGTTTTNTYKYNRKGQLVTAVGQGTWGKLTFTYDENGRIASSKRTSPEFSGSIKSTYAYDSKGALKKETCTNSGDTGVTTYKNTYKNGRLVKSRSYEDGHLTTTTTFAYKQVKASKSAIRLAKAQQKQILSQMPIDSIVIAHK